MRGIPLLFVDKVGCTNWNVSCRIMPNQYPTNSPRLGLTQLCLEHWSDNEVTHIWCRWQPATSGSSSDRTRTELTCHFSWNAFLTLHTRVSDDIRVALHHHSPFTAIPRLLLWIHTSAFWDDAMQAGRRVPTLFFLGGGQWRTREGLGVPNPHRNSEGPPKSCQIQPDCENC